MPKEATPRTCHDRLPGEHVEHGPKDARLGSLVATCHRKPGRRYSWAVMVLDAGEEGTRTYSLDRNVNGWTLTGPACVVSRPRTLVEGVEDALFDCEAHPIRG